eukprot:3933380-Prymnesium_polylepis.1
MPVVATTVPGNPDATATTNIAVAVAALATALNAALTVSLAPEGGRVRWAPRPPRITNGVYNISAQTAGEPPPRQHRTHVHAHAAASPRRLPRPSRPRFAFTGCAEARTSGGGTPRSRRSRVSHACH